MSDTPRDPGPSLGGAMAALTVMVAVAVGVVSLVVARAGGENGTVSTGTAPTAAATHVGLSEFAIAPADLTVPSGSSLHVQNDGAVVHNLAVVDTDLETPDLGAGEAAELPLGDLPPGEYRLLCLIPGHDAAGMTGTLTVTDGPVAAPAPGGTSSGAAHHGHGGDPDYAAMEAAMLASIDAFPAETEGVGNPVLEPTEVLADGTLVFDLRAAITPWEVEPGKVVDAWTYNGVAPGPWIDLDLGDRVQVRFRNDLPVGMDIHWHGVEVPNSQDGVAPLTQAIVEPGTSFTYEFTATLPAVGMYHAHAHSIHAVPNGMFAPITIGEVPVPRGETISGQSVPADMTIAQEIPWC